MVKYFEDMETQNVYEMPDDATVDDLNRFLGLLPEPPTPESKPRDDDDLEGITPDTPELKSSIPRPEAPDLPALPVEGVEQEELPAVVKSKPVDVRRPLDDLVYDHLFKTEGASGSNIAGDVPTGMRGLTTATYERIKEEAGDPTMSEQDASKYYIRQMDAGFSDKMLGYNTLPLEAKISFLDNAYNMNWQSMLNWQGLKTDFVAFGKGEVTAGDVMENLLDTANADSKSMRGLAKRRAQLYNAASPQDKITHVEQKDNGINYYKGNELFFSYKKPKHQSSALGKIAVD